MKSTRVVLMALLSTLALVVVIFLVLAFLPNMRIEDIEFEGVCSYSIKSTVSKQLYSSYLFMPRGGMKKEILGDGYVSDVDFSFGENTLRVKCEPFDEGVVVTDYGRAYFYKEGEFESIDMRDIDSLVDKFLLLEMDSIYLDYLLGYMDSSGLRSLMDYLAVPSDSFSLITRAYFDNNNADGTICLVLQMDSLSSNLVISDLSRIGYLDACISAISKENNSIRYDTIFSNMNYELKSYGLVRYKR